MIVVKYRPICPKWYTLLFYLIEFHFRCEYTMKAINYHYVGEHNAVSAFFLYLFIFFPRWKMVHHRGPQGKVNTLASPGAPFRFLGSHIRVCHGPSTPAEASVTRGSQHWVGRRRQHTTAVCDCTVSPFAACHTVADHRIEVFTLEPVHKRKADHQQSPPAGCRPGHGGSSLL